jgi:pyruvate formate lyase activating enzyme
LENADRLLDHGSEIIFRVPVIPGINDTEKEINAFMEFFSKRKGKLSDVHLLPYHKIGSDKYRRMEKEYSFQEVEEPTDSHMRELKKKIESCGVVVTVGG